MSRRVAAVDLGAGSGRVAVGSFDGERVTVEVVHRFANQPLWLPDGLHWNLPGLFAEVLDGLGRAGAAGALDGVGVDSWGCDYALLDSHHRLLGLPYHYRDRGRTAPHVMAEAFTRVDRHELYARTGIQTMPINTVFQLFAERDGAAVRAAEHVALIPDLIGLWLTGVLVNEATVASTTGLLEAGGLRWATDLIQRLGISARPFGAEVATPGTEVGRIRAEHGRAGRAAGAPVHTVGGHDTASAFAAATRAGPDAAVLSSGTWSLLGVELPEPQLGPAAEAGNLTNERGIGNTVRLLRNVMGMWLLEECRREWSAPDGVPAYEELYRAAAAAPWTAPVFDPDDASLLHPGPMSGRIVALCVAAGQSPPADRGELVRSILLSLACKYRLVLEALESVCGHRIDVVQIVGGGSRNTLLCQLTADVLGREVLAGPAEATLVGNLLVQLLAAGELATRAEMRALTARSVTLTLLAPLEPQRGEDVYERFCELTPVTRHRPIGIAV